MCFPPAQFAEVMHGSREALCNSRKSCMGRGKLWAIRGSSAWIAGSSRQFGLSVCLFVCLSLDLGKLQVIHGSRAWIVGISRQIAEVVHGSWEALCNSACRPVCSSVCLWIVGTSAWIVGSSMQFAEIVHGSWEAPRKSRK